MKNLFKLLIVILTAPLVATSANAACGGKVVFAYAPDWTDVSKVVQIERYYNSTTNTWYYDSEDCSKSTVGYVDVPLEGTFSNAIPFVFNHTRTAYTHTPDTIRGNVSNQSVSGSTPILCTRTLAEANMLKCTAVSSVPTGAVFSATKWAKNVVTSSDKNYVLSSITSLSRGTYSLVYSNTTPSVIPPIFRFMSGQRTTIPNLLFDRNNPGVVCGDATCSTFVGSFSLVNQSMQSLGMTDVGFGYATSCASAPDITVSTELSRPVIYCDYNSGTDDNAICRINYPKASFFKTLSASTTNIQFCSVGAVRLTPADPSEVITVKNPINTSSTIVTVPDCYKVEVYGLKSNGAYPRLTHSDSILNTMFYKNNKWYSDRRCINEIPSSASFKMEMPYRTVLPIGFTSTMPTDIVASPMDESGYGQFTYAPGTPFKCENTSASNSVSCHFSTDVEINGDTTYYVSEYLYNPHSGFWKTYSEITDDTGGHYSYKPDSSPCNKLEFYGLKNIGTLWEPEWVNSDKTFNTLYSKEMYVYTDSNCTELISAGGGDSWNIIDKSVMPYAYSKTKPSSVNGVLATDTQQTLNASNLRIVQANYDGLANQADAFISEKGFMIDGIPDEDTIYYVTDYIYADNNRRLSVADDGSTIDYYSFVESDGGCYRLDVYGLVNNGTAANPDYDTSESITTTVYTKNNTFYSDSRCTNSTNLALTMPDQRVAPLAYSPSRAEHATGTLVTAASGQVPSSLKWECMIQSGKVSCNPVDLNGVGEINANTQLVVTEYVYTDDSDKEIIAAQQPGKGLVYQLNSLCFAFNINLGGTDTRRLSYSPASQLYYNSSDCSAGTEFADNLIVLTMNSSQTSVPAVFATTKPASTTTVDASSWSPPISTFRCDYNSNISKTQLQCTMGVAPTEEGTTFYPVTYARLDSRALTISGNAISQHVISYCNSLTLGTTTFYSMIDSSLNPRWYSDSYCQKQLTGDYPLPYPATNGAVPLAFATQVPSTLGANSDRTISNTGPIYCEYDSSSSASGAKCKYNTTGNILMPGGQFAYLSSPETYAVKFIATPVDGKHFKITNDIAAQTTTLTYWSAVCNALNIYFMTADAFASYETKTIYRTTGSWCNDSACTDCGYTDAQILEYNDGYPAYFANAYVTGAYKNISSTNNYTISDNSQSFSCSYSDETSLSCPALASSAETNANGRWFVPVYVKKLVGGAIGGGQLKSFNTVSTGTTKKVNVTYYPAQCSDYVNVHFYGFSGLGEYGEIRQSSNGSTAKYYFEGATPYWVSHDGRTAGSFADLGIGSVINKSITVGEEPGVTFANGVSGYRATYVGGPALLPTAIPANTVITKTTGIVDPSNTAHAYDIMVAGDSLPTIPKSQFTDGTGFTKNVYYRLLYAANCLDPDGSESGSTCELEIRPNGRALYKNQCLPGWGDGNFGDDTLANVTMTQQSISVSNKCEM